MWNGEKHHILLVCDRKGKLTENFIGKKKPTCLLLINFMNLKVKKYQYNISVGDPCFIEGSIGNARGYFGLFKGRKPNDLPQICLTFFTITHTNCTTTHWHFSFPSIQLASLNRIQQLPTFQNKPSFAILEDKPRQSELWMSTVPYKTEWFCI